MRAFAGGAATTTPGDWTKIEFSNDGQKLLIATNTSAHYVLDAFDGRLLAYCLRPQGPTNRVSPSGVAALRAQGQTTAKGGRASGQGDACFSPDGRFLVSGTGAQGAVCVWDLEGLEAGEPAAERVVRPMCELGSDIEAGGKSVVGFASVVGYNPRHNLLVTADRGVVFWLPEMD